jgi:hypothetical protein
LPKTGHPVAMPFFDRYPRFYQTSSIGTRPNRLNSRYRALIESNRSCIENCAILDIASHDGRWSFAAIKAGARFVLGVEARPHLVQAARETFRIYGVPCERYSFVAGDIFNQLAVISPAPFDTIFCFGFFYHTMRHIPLLEGITRLRPRHLILDTLISPSPQPVIEIRTERTTSDAAAVAGSSDVGDASLVGHPSRRALQMMLKNFGFRMHEFDWRSPPQDDWTGIEDYRDGARITMRCDISGS